MPSTRHAGARRAPDACASEMSSRITSRSPRSCRRPRPPRRVSPLFFENEQRRSFGQCLLLASELALELANALVRRRRGSLRPRQGQCATARTRRASPLRVRGRRSAPRHQVWRPRRGHEPSARRSTRARRASVVSAIDRQATRLLQPARQVLLSDSRLSSQLRCTHCVLPGEPLDHLLFEGHGERLGHVVVEFSPLRGSTSNDATTILAQGERQVRDILRTPAD